jgi:hypothetical protein
MLRLQYYLLISFVIFASCVSVKHKNSIKRTEVIQNRFQQFTSASNDLSKPILDFNEKVWYKDSMAIEEVRYQNVVTDSKNNTSVDYPIRNYRFNDLRKRTVYEYKSFSDTAAIIKKYSLDDTSIKLASGWNFKHFRNWGYDNVDKNLSDTVIENVTYKRVQLRRTMLNFKYIMICYFRCDKKGTIFNLDEGISKITDCPLVKYYHIPLQKKGLNLFSEIIFSADKFTKEEQKVFDAWKKYANSNPL